MQIVRAFGRLASRFEAVLEARPWLVLVIAAVIALPTIVLGEIAAADTRTRLRDAQMQAQSAAATRAARRVSFILGDVGSYLIEATRPNAPLVAAVTARDGKAMHTALVDLATRYTYTPGYFVADTEGTIVAGVDCAAVAGPETRVIGRSSNALSWVDTPHSRVGTRFMTPDEMARTFRTPEIRLFDLYVPKDRSGEDMVIGTGGGGSNQPRPGEGREGYIGGLGVRLMDQTGRLAGALVADLNVGPFMDAMFELQGIAKNAYLVDRNGRLVRRLDVYYDRDSTIGRDLSSAASVRTVTGGGGLKIDGVDPLVGGEAVLASARAPDVAGEFGADLPVGWTVIASEPLDHLYADLDAEAGLVRAIRIALAIGIMVFAGLLALALRHVVRQRAQLATVNTSLELAGRELAAATQQKSEFLANMSHELRTPLNSIIGFADVLEQKLFGDLNAKQAEYVGDISGSGRHLLALVNEILDLSKVEAGRMELERTEFSAAEMVRTALTFVRERAASHAIQLSADIASDLGTAYADERKIRQVLLNLLSNAAKFTPAGGTIRVSATCQDDELLISVSDTGIGIAPEDQATVFEEFQQVGKPSDRSREGTGLGLTLAKRFVELHGGRIWLESAVGKGTTFAFAIPVGHTAPVPVTA